MFFGEFEHAVDDKGRVAIPSKFRPKLAEGLVITRGLDGCLFVYPMQDWERLAERIAALPTTQAGVRQFQRLIFSGAADCQLDAQGRIVLPGGLREYAGIERDAVVIGVHTRLEVWARTRWADQRARVEQEGDLIAEQLSSLGI